MAFELPAARDFVDDFSSLERTGDDEKSMLAFRKEALALLRKVGFDLGKTPVKPKKKLDWDDRYTLIVSVDDHEYDMALHAVPVTVLNEALRDALGEINGRTFAGPADLNMVEWAAAVRVLAAMGDERNAEWFYKTHVDEHLAQFKRAKVKPPPLKEVQSLWNVIGDHRLGWLDNQAKPLKLDVWFSSSFAYQKAM